MSTLKSTILTSALLLARFGTVNAQTADEIFTKHFSAVGGDNWDKVSSLKITNTTTMQGMGIEMTNVVVPHKAARTDMSIMGTNGYTIVTDKEGWTFMPMMGQTAPEQMNAEQLKQQQESELDLVSKNHVNIKAEAAKAEVLGKEKVGDAECFKVKVTDKDNEEQTMYFDASTYYLVCVKGKVEVQGQKVDMTQNYSDFKKLDGGIVMAMKIDIPGQANIEFKTVEVNKPIDESVFKPAK